MLGKFSKEVTPVTWTEIDSFSRLLGIQLEPWEAEALMVMSKAYCFVYHQAKEPNYPAPYFIDTEEFKVERSNRVDAGFKALALRKKSKKRL